MFVITVYYSERIQTQISKGKRHLGKGPGETRWEFPGVPSWWSQGSVPLSGGVGVCMEHCHPEMFSQDLFRDPSLLARGMTSASSLFGQFKKKLFGCTRSWLWSVGSSSLIRD